MHVAQLMQTDVESIAPDALVNDAALAMADAHITGLPAWMKLGRMIGVISTTDILGSAQEPGAAGTGATAAYEATSVRDLMTPRPVTTGPGATIQEAAQLLLDANVHRLFVVDGDHLVGVISTTDILRAVANGQL